jgi:hypothetical protein
MFETIGKNTIQNESVMLESNVAFPSPTALFAMREGLGIEVFLNPPSVFPNFLITLLKLTWLASGFLRGLYKATLHLL